MKNDDEAHRRPPQDLSVGEMARRSGVTVSALHFYETKGLIRSARTSGNQRRYSRDMLRRVSVIKAAQRLGFTLDEVTELLEAGRHRHGAGLQARTEAKLAEVEQRIADLEVIRDSLLAAQAAGCDDLMTCAEVEGCPVPFV